MYIMMKKYFLLLFLFFSFMGYSQKSQTNNENAETYQNAEFLGGDGAFTKEFFTNDILLY